MLQRLFVFFGLLLFIPYYSYSQASKVSVIKGRVLNSTTQSGIEGLTAILQGLNVSTTTKFNGDFSIDNVAYGKQTLIISGVGYKNDTLLITVDKDEVTLKDIYPVPAEATTTIADLPTINIQENNLAQDDDASVTSSQNSAGIYSANLDQFLFITGFIFGQYNFSPRGVDNMELQVNGIQLQDLERGYNSYSQMGGLNDVLHGRNTTYGLAPSGYAYGSTNGVNYVEATAADQQKGTNISYNITNRNYRNRIMLTHNSGIMKNGWVYSVSGSHRWAQEGYVPGTFYDGYSFYGAISKIIRNSQFNLTAFDAPTTYGQAVFAAIDEVYQLAGDNQYNSAWGWQEGKKHNSKIVNTNQPLVIANYTYKPSERTRWNTAVGYQFGKYRNSIIDFYNAYNPNPDYYRNLPNYYMNFSTPMPDVADAVRAQLQGHPEQLQINWDGFYNSNYTNIETVRDINGIAGNDFTGKRSMYVNSDKVDDLKKISFNTNIEHSQSEHINVYGGLRFASQEDRYYKQLFDLLGGDFYLNYNQFANQQAVQDPSYAQNDLNKPNQLIKIGDKYGYDYKINIKQSEAWGQAAFSYNQVDYFIAANTGYTTFRREGFMKNGLFPDNSFGKSEMHDFITYRTKGGLTWKINSRNNVYLNAGYTTEAPKVTNTYISAQKRDFIIANPVTQKSKTLELGYLFKSKALYARVTGYVTDISDAVINKLFFNDDPAAISFVNYIMKGVNMRSIGAEFSGNLRLDEEWSINGIAAVGQFYYTNRPEVSFYQDNQPATVAPIERKVYIKNYYVASGPQSIYCLALNYHSRKYWNGRINFNYTDNNFVDINPDRRTQEAADLVVQGSPQWNKIYAQEKLPAAFTVDVSAGKSFNLDKLSKKWNRKTLLVFNSGVVNALNKTDIKTAGYEQLRYDYALRNPSKFPNKYDYAYGINYYATLSLRF